ncbi:uncharacterized protein LOC135004051 isoform X2 [Pseudophryne corroboree]|uniref:uncharacterized protein LOC135004051 isoform X2 n=1 Tax=Pseudophryne corroboree TaxID=495146 RepID=UPI003081476D
MLRDQVWFGALPLITTAQTFKMSRDLVDQARPLQMTIWDALKMPHVEKNFSHYVYDSSSEPHVKRSRPDYPTSWARRDTALYDYSETQPQKWSLPMVSEGRYYQPNKHNSEGPRVPRDLKNDCAVEHSSESFRNHSYQAPCDRRDYNNINQRPFELAVSDKCKDGSDESFSETSSAFIGPLFQTPIPVSSGHDASNKPGSLAFKIKTVELGKTATKSKGEDGIDYELRQFYKELNELDSETDDQVSNANHTVVANLEHFSPSDNKAPASLPASSHQSQAPSSQAFSSFPNKSSTLMPLDCPPKEASTSQVKCPTLPPYNQVSFDRQTPFNTRDTSFLNHSMPPPGFESFPPPSFIVPYGPPPPRYNYPLTIPRQNNLPPPLHNPVNSYHAVNNNRPPWHSSHVPPESRPTSQGMSYVKPSPPSTGERAQQEHQREDICGQKYRHSGDLPLHQASNASHELYPHKYREHSSCRNSQRKLVLLRGVPGSGKSTLARTLLGQSSGGIVLSTDDYFSQETGYTYDVKLLGDAHSWNHNRALRAMDDGRSPIIIDNTNIQAWEMKPYVQMSLDRSYGVEILEPDTWWKLDPYELEKRNTHRVPREKISQMLERYEYDMTVSGIMNSVEPRHVRPNRPPSGPRPRAPNLKEKRGHKKRQQKRRKQILNKNNVMPLGEKDIYDSEDPVGRCKVMEDSYDAANFIICGIGKPRMKINYSTVIRQFVKEGYISKLTAICLPQCPNSSPVALLGMLPRVMVPMDNPISSSTLETQIAVTVNQHLCDSPVVSLAIGGVLCDGMKSGRYFFRCDQDFQKSVHILDYACPESQYVVKAGTDLYCSLISCLAVQHSLHLYSVKGIHLQYMICQTNRPTCRKSDNKAVQNGNKMQGYLEGSQSNDPSWKYECIRIMDKTKLKVENKREMGRPHVRRKNIYKLAPTFQHPRILSTSPKNTWRNSCDFDAGANILYNEYEITPVIQSRLTRQNVLGHDELQYVLCDGGLNCNNTSSPKVEHRACRPGFSEDDLCAVDTEYSSGHSNPVLTGVQADSLPGLCLPIQFARQLVELFGSPGVELGKLTGIPEQPTPRMLLQCRAWFISIQKCFGTRRLHCTNRT